MGQLYILLDEMGLDKVAINLSYSHILNHKQKGYYHYIFRSRSVMHQFYFKKKLLEQVKCLVVRTVMTITIEDFTGIYLLIISLTLKDITLLFYHLLLLKLLIFAKHTASHCDVSSFNINCLEYNMNYTIKNISCQ